MRLWDRSRRTSRVLKGHNAEVRGLRFSFDGRWLASTGEDRRPASGTSTPEKPAITPRPCRRGVRPGVSPNGTHIASASADSSLRVWRVEPGDVTLLGSPPPEPGSRRQEFSPGGTLLASASGKGTVRLWRLPRGDVRLLEGHTADVSGTRVLAGWTEPGVQQRGQDGTLLGRRIESEPASGCLETPCRAPSFSPDGSLLAVGADNNVHASTFTQGRKERQLAGHQFPVGLLAFSPDGRLIGSAAQAMKADSGKNDPVLWLWEAASGRARPFPGHDDTVCAMAFSPDGRSVASGGMDKTVRLWSLETGEGRLLGAHGSIVSTVAFSPDGRLLASGGNRPDDSALERGRRFRVAPSGDTPVESSASASLRTVAPS